MAAPRFYSWDDVGSPGRNLSGNTQNRFKQILKACLVDGYGDKKGAGWSIGHEHTNGFSLVSGRGDFVINFVSDLTAQGSYPAMSSYCIHIYCANSITSSDSAIIDGANLCSGDFRRSLTDPMTRHNVGSAREVLKDELSSLHWTVLADENTVIISASTASSKTAPVDFSFSIYFGEVVTTTGIANSLCLSGGITAYNRASYTHTYSAGYSSPKSPVSGLNESVKIDAFPYAREEYEFDPKGEYPAFNCLELLSPKLLSGSLFFGRLKGVVYDGQLHGLSGVGSWLKNLGFSGVDFNDRNKLVALAGNQYCFVRHTCGAGSYLTDNPEFWG